MSIDVKKLVVGYKEYGIRLRRELHMYPELGGREVRTAQRIEEELDKMGIPHRRVAATNVVGLIEGGEGPTIALRADIDGLPVEEDTGLEYRSRTEGVMHACGHDGHIAALLSAAGILQQSKEKLNGKVKLIFQSAEENGTGAAELIEAGELDDVEGIFGLHIWNYLDAGKIGVNNGPQMTEAIEFQIHLEGNPGHGSTPHLAADATLPIAALAVQIMNLSGSKLPPLSDKVLTLGRIYSGPNRTIEHGDVYNIIQGNSYLEGSIRTFSDEEGEKFREEIEKLVKGTEIMYGVKGKLVWNVHTVALINDDEMAETGRSACRELWGEDVFDQSFGKQMASEDFALYRSKTRTCFAFVGSRNPAKNAVAAHHSPKFIMDEDAIERAACLHAQFAIDFLKKCTR